MARLSLLLRGLEAALGLAVAARPSALAVRLDEGLARELARTRAVAPRPASPRLPQASGLLALPPLPPEPCGLCGIHLGGYMYKTNRKLTYEAYHVFSL